MLLISRGIHANIYTSDITIKKVYHIHDQQKCDIAYYLSKKIPQFVPKVYSYQSPNLIMERIEGITLENYVYDKNTILKVITGIIQALSAFHSTGYCHLDFHSGNIIVTPENEIKIIDFDTAKLIGQEIILDYIRLKHNIATLIFHNFPQKCLSFKYIKHTEKDVIDYDKDPQFATELYNIFAKLK